MGIAALGLYVAAQFDERNFTPVHERGWNASLSIWRRGLAPSFRDHEILLVFVKTMIVNAAAGWLFLKQLPAFLRAAFPLHAVPHGRIFVFGISVVLLGTLLRRAFSPLALYRGKITGSILTLARLGVMDFFVFLVFPGFRGLPPSHGAPQVGQQAPEFTLPDINGKPAIAGYPKKLDTFQSLGCVR